MHLSAIQADRAAGALLGAAAGDALGVPYEYGSSPLDDPPRPKGGGLGGFAPSQWSDDTDMAAALLLVTADGVDLRTERALDAVAGQFLRWYDSGPPDVGNQTRAVLSSRPPDAGQMRSVASELHRRSGRTAGNGSLMRTAPVALAHLGDPDAVAGAARAVSALTHHDPVAGDGCALWCLAIEHAVRTGELDVRVGLGRVDRGYWGPLLDEAERGRPADFAASNGWVVSALQSAWSALHAAADLESALVAAVRGGGDTDTVAAIAGALGGAVHGASAVPRSWVDPLHGWPQLVAADLTVLSLRTAHGDGRSPADCPQCLQA